MAANTPAAGAARPLECLLRHLDAVRESTPGSCMARCPAHEDRTPSLHIRECGDGTVLIHCFAGCPPAAVLEAVGLGLPDLFPPEVRRVQGRDGHCSGPRPPGQRWDYRALLIEAERPQAAVLGCVQLSSTAWRMALRDRWIGWDDAARRAHLQRVVNHRRFLLLPWVEVKNRASATCSPSCPTLTVTTDMIDMICIFKDRSGGYGRRRKRPCTQAFSPPGGAGRIVDL